MDVRRRIWIPKIYSPYVGRIAYGLHFLVGTFEEWPALLPKKLRTTRPEFILSGSAAKCYMALTRRVSGEAAINAALALLWQADQAWLKQPAEIASHLGFNDLEQGCNGSCDNLERDQYQHKND